MDYDILQFCEFRFPVIIGAPTLHALNSNATNFELYWMIKIRCQGTDVVIDGETHHYWQPKVYLESMRFSCRNWKQLEGQHYLTKADDDDRPAIYLYEHNDLEKSDIHFVSRDGVKFDVDWNFVCSGQNGRVRTKVTFTEVTVWLNEVKDEVMARRRLEQDLELSLFGEPEVVPHPLVGPRFKLKPIP